MAAFYSTLSESIVDAFVFNGHEGCVSSVVASGYHVGVFHAKYNS